MKNVSSNLWKLGAYKFLGDFLVIAPIIIPFYQAYGLNATQILVVQAAFSLAMLLFEVPSGYFSDVAGRRRTLLLGALFYPVGMLVYAVSQSFWQFIVAEVILAFAYSMRSGTDSALLYDSLQQLGRTDEYRKYEGRVASLERLGAALASVIGGLAALVWLRLPFLLNIVTGIFLCIFASMLVEPARLTRKGDNPWPDILRIVRYALAHRKILGVIVFASMVLTTGIISIWGYFLHLGKWHAPLYWYGIYFAVLQLSSAFGARAAHRIEKLIGERASLYLLFAIPLILVLVGTVASVYIVLMAFVHAFLWGVSTPLFLDMLNRHINSDMRATVISVSGMIGRLTYVIIGPAFGMLADHISLSAALVSLAGYFVCIASAGLFLWFRGGEHAAAAGVE